MVLSIKFTSKNIYITEQETNKHCVKVHRTFLIDMPDGAFQRGVVINTSEVADKVRVVLRENAVRTKKAIVCMNGGDITDKECSVPVASERHTQQMVQNELRKSDLYKNEYLYDYIYGDRSETKDGEMQNIIAYLMPKQLIQNYMQTIQRAGLIPVKFKPLNDGMDKIIKLLELSDKQTLTILACVDAINAEVCIIGKGKKPVNRSIYLEDDDILEENIFILATAQTMLQNMNQEQKMLDNLTETISKLVQFQSQRDKDSVVSEILLYGELAQRNSFVEKVAEITGIKTMKCRIPDKYLKIVGKDCNLMSNIDLIAIDSSKLVGEKKELSFVKQFNEQKSGYITTKDKLPVYIMAALVIVGFIVGGVFKELDYQNRKQSERLEANIQEIITSDQYIQNLRNIRLLEEYTAYNAVSEEYIRILEETSRFESELIKQIDDLKPGDIEISSYAYENGVLIVSCKAKDQEGPAKFAEVVTEVNYFSTVEYTGFSLESDILGNSNYSFLLKCKF